MLWFAETETTWDAYDVFYLRLDEQRRRTSRPPGGRARTRSPGRRSPYAPPDRGWGHGGYPAIGVTFHAATEVLRVADGEDRPALPAADGRGMARRAVGTVRHGAAAAAGDVLVRGKRR